MTQASRTPEWDLSTHWIPPHQQEADFCDFEPPVWALTTSDSVSIQPFSLPTRDQITQAPNLHPKAVNGTSISVLGTARISISLASRVIEINAIVVKDEHSPVDLLVGRDALTTCAVLIDFAERRITFGSEVVPMIRTPTVTQTPN
ncbi:hypothetical protein L596_006223 [Steinernema carpocapsae]|uniref:Aspartic peptidase DDI1-type domain-containing protein n=1 Tax=Steinernema carpocapsae TaxID=34508 RepID=A0A4U8V1N9_STECR|nr:hypothetical protein L596_006223 [Steinernema carpocapsae]